MESGWLYFAYGNLPGLKSTRLVCALRHTPSGTVQCTAYVELTCFHTITDNALTTVFVLLLAGVFLVTAAAAVAAATVLVVEGTVMRRGQGAAPPTGIVGLTDPCGTMLE